MSINWHGRKVPYRTIIPAPTNFCSRLDRLLKLIDTAQSPAYRRLAAKQLGGLVQAQPNQARPLLQMVQNLSDVMLTNLLTVIYNQYF